jgi:hypothetical protein
MIDEPFNTKGGTNPQGSQPAVRPTDFSTENYMPNKGDTTEKALSISETASD